MKHLTSKANINFVLSIVFIALLSFVTSFFFVWWSLVLVSFAVLVCFRQKPLRAFLSGFTAVFLLWFILSLYLTSLNHNILATLLTKMFFGVSIPYLLNLLTGFIGGLVGGLGALLGSHFMAILKERTTQTALRHTAKQSPSETSPKAPTTPIKHIYTQEPQATKAFMSLKESPTKEPNHPLSKTPVHAVVKPAASEKDKTPTPSVVQAVSKQEAPKPAASTSKPSVQPPKPRELTLPKIYTPFKIPSSQEQTETKQHPNKANT